MTTYHGREFGSKIGSGGAATAELSSLQRKERLKSLLTETYDLKNDPYLYKNHIGAHECKLCGTVHRDEANYVDHTKGKRHQEELAKRQARLSSGKGTAAPLVEKKKIEPRKTEKIGRPAFKVLKQLDRETLAHSILFRIEYPKIEEGMRPRFRFMSAFEQHVEPPNDNFQYLLFAAEPYQVVAFKIPNVEIDRSVGKLLTNWDEESKMFTLQLHLKDKVEGISFADEEGSSASGSLWGEGAAGGDMDDVEQNEAAW